jgi:hypothetical protein
MFSKNGGFDSTGLLELQAGQLDGDEYGFAVAVTPRADGIEKDVWIGAPDRSVNGHEYAGSVFRIAIHSDGTPESPEEITQNSPGVPGTAENDDEFGIALAPASNGVVVGVPLEAVGSRQQAGMVERIRTDRTTNELTTSQGFTQDSTGVPGTAEAYDLFGWAVSPGGLVVGAPGETLRGHEAAGVVDTFTESKTTDDWLVPSKAFDQDSPGIPGAVEANDLFGESVVTGTFNCAGVKSMAIAAPEESLGSTLYAGSVTVLPVTGSTTACPAKALSQGSGLPGTAEKNDLTGWTLGLVAGDPDAVGGRVDQLLIGVPQESVNGVTWCGRAIAWKPSSTSVTYHFASGDTEKLFFGDVLPMAA